MKINIACCGIIIDNNKILITKRNVSPFKDRYVLPGGKLNSGESLIECLKREIKEETGIDVENCSFFDFVELFVEKNYYLVMYFVCDEWKNGIKINEDEISDFKWVSASDFKNYYLGDATKKILEKFFNDWNNRKVY